MSDKMPDGATVLFRQELAKNLRKMADEAEHGMYDGVVISAWGYHPHDVNKEGVKGPLFNIWLPNDNTTATLMVGTLVMATDTVKAGFQEARKSALEALMAAEPANKQPD